MRNNAAARGCAGLMAVLAAFTSTAAGAATRSSAFADFDPGPRMMAMGGAGVAQIADPTATYWNPAGLLHARDTGDGHA